MFELKLALKYLLPRRRALSTSLISLMSIVVISMVVWLILVFLSVTAGIEKNWLQKLTSLNAPLRIAPTDQYFASYYYQVDSFSSASSYSYKTIGEKARSETSDPYEPGTDMEIPVYIPETERKVFNDPVKSLYTSLETLREKNTNLTFHDYEMSGALMRLSLNRPLIGSTADKTSFLSQMSYLLSFPENNPTLSTLLIPPDKSDLKNLLYQIGKSHTEWQTDTPQGIFPSEDLARFIAFFENVAIESVHLLPFSARYLEKGTYEAYAHEGENVHRVSLEKSDSFPVQGTLVKDTIGAYFQTNEGKRIPLPAHAKVIMEKSYPAKVDHSSLKKVKRPKEILIEVSVQGKSLLIPYQKTTIERATPQIFFENAPEHKPLWSYHYQGKWHLPQMDHPGILLPKTYRDSGVFLGDNGYLAYVSPTASSTQEMRLSFYVAGFYDPGIMPTGNRCLFVPSDMTSAINASSQSFSPDGTPTNGIFVWFDPIQSAGEVKEKILSSLQEKGLDSYWSVKTFKEYEFSKQLMQQFQSDRTLFMLIAIIIITVACSNIISLLVILVKDKKKEIAILASMGASKKSIVCIFGISGVFMGMLSSIIGTVAAIITLKNLHFLVAVLSKIQGYDAFQAAFFGESLPNDLSFDALTFVLIATPIISLLAGLIPAFKASKMQPSAILRSE